MLVVPNNEVRRALQQNNNTRGQLASGSCEVRSMRYDSRRDDPLLRKCERATATLCHQCNSRVRPHAANPAITPNRPVYRRHPHSLLSTMTFGLEPLVIPTPWSLACGERHTTRSHGDARVALCDSSRFTSQLAVAHRNYRNRYSRRIMMSLTG